MTSRIAYIRILTQFNNAGDIRSYMVTYHIPENESQSERIWRLKHIFECQRYLEPIRYSENFPQYFILIKTAPIQCLYSLQ